MAGLRVRVEGEPAAQPLLLASNHVSWLDILALGGSLGATFVAKAEIDRWPVVGWLARNGEVVFVERAARGAAGAQAAALASALGRGRPVVLFAEGTTGDGRSIRPFRSTLFQAGREATIQPVLLDYGAATDAVQWPEGESAGVNAWRLLGRRGRVPLVIRLLPPFPADGADRKALAARAEAAVARALAGVTPDV